MTSEEGERWKRIALFLADCHAATSECEGSLRRTSQSSRRRFKSICQRALDMIDGKEDPCPSKSEEERVKKRLLRQAEGG